MRILDAGCGRGFLIKDELMKKGECFGIDPNAKFIREAKRNVKKGKFFVGGIEKIRFENEMFDEAYCYDVLEHVDDYEKSIKQLHRVLKKSGKLYILIPHFRSESVLKKIKPSYFSKNMHKRIFYPKKIRISLMKDGFKIIKMRDREFFRALRATYMFLRKLPYEEHSGLPVKEDIVTYLVYFLSAIFELRQPKLKGELKRRRLYYLYPFITFLRIVLYPLRLITLILDNIYPKSTYIEAEKLR